MAVDVKRQLLKGSLTAVPKLPSKVIRIFMSSTFGDMSAERNVIGEAEPELSQWCRKQGLDFQLVDMRWGVKDEATTDHMTTFLCLQEIKKCQDISLGPNFMFLLGQRYGYRPIPAKILSSEFQVLLEYIVEESSLKLVNDWYLLDENSIPSEHVLQSVTDDWHSVSSKLAVVLRTAAAEAVKAGKLTAEEKKKYFSSVTEQEIEAALGVKDPELHCFGFIREIEDLYDHTGDKDSVSITYFDADEDGAPIEEVKFQLDELKNCYLASHLPERNIISLVTHWQEPGIVRDVHEYQSYFQTLKDNFIANVKALTVEALKRQDPSDVAEDPLLLEVIHHADFCLKRCAIFHGCDDTIQQIVDKVCMDTASKPLVIHGPSGSGKTSVMAKVAAKIKADMRESVNVVIRFLGTSSSSSSILQVFQSLVEQICVLYDLPLPDHSTLNNYDNLISYFPRLLKNVANLVERGSLLILLDSIDQLESTFRAYTCKWLPRVCPQNVQIIVSTISDMLGVLEWLKEILNEESCFIGMKPLPEVTGIDILHHSMKDVHRKVTVDQFNILKNAFNKCPQPLFLKLLFDEAKRWKSYTVVSEEQLAVRVDEAIWKLFERLERQFGVTLVSHALGYITASRNGLTSEELLHVLSLDDEVLDEIYQYWPPPDPTEVAVPNLIWARLKFELEEYLVERQAEGKTVLVLYHRQFTMAATERYIKDPVSFRSHHQVLAEFFSGKWASEEKELHLTQQDQTLNPFRKVPSQPLRFESEYNRRKLRQLPYHMTLSGTEFHGDLCKYIYGNFDFLDTYIKAFSTQQLIEEISFSLMSMDDSSNLKSQVMLLRDTLRYRTLQSGLNKNFQKDLPVNDHY
ncbi:NACHT domain- and WD repeat-containing protein 1 [Holothuria leucospilota]|uniref:NACHT domain- and WD repeat-containing protein 1 n=1 Tax=Holothuria leucospilota TaxID=206669 RepID=A0A9Q1CJK1_HOLLE|nr:NACHT domain- and WD repeat-containing protein 1 [Holothuria leucospilota]